MKNIRKNILKITITLLLTAIIVVGGAFGCDCSFGKKKKDDTPTTTPTGAEYTIKFKESDKTIIVGDSFTVSKTDFEFNGTEPDEFDFSLKEGDKSIIKVDGSKVTALKVGKTTLTATDKATQGITSCNVKVVRSPDTVDFEIVTEKRSNLISADASEVDVYALVNGGKTDVSGYDFTWEIDGVKSSYDGSIYTFSPQANPKTVKVKASVKIGGKDYSDELTLNWATEFTSPVNLSKTSGATVQTMGDTTPVTYSLTYDKGSNTTPVIDWFVGGELVKQDSDTLTFTPTNLGKNIVTATVNGTLATASDNIVSISGQRVPTGVRVDYDSMYPSVLVTFDEGRPDERFEVKLFRKTDNATQTFETDSNECLIASDKIDLFAHDYEISVKSLGDGLAMSESDYSEAVKQNKLTENTRAYLEKTWFDGNYFISSDEEFYKIYDYFMLYRSRPLLNEDKAFAEGTGKDTNTEEYTDTHKIYLGYTPSKSISAIVGEAFDRANYTGSYDMKSAQSGNEVTLNCNYSTSSSPSQTHTKMTLTQTALNGSVLHVSKTGREAGATLPIDSVTKTAKVSTTDQLYRVAEMGYRPVYDNGTRAQKYYDYARALLMEIIDDEMSDVDKAHAIYDWIMWRVYYDTQVTKISAISQAVTYGSFYLEGVLTDKNYLAVCDGMSKTFSLLCNMEGLPCIRVAGTADSGSGAGGHAWNKVQVDGKWYIVDCTWGDMTVMLDDKSTELSTHMHFLKTDGEMLTHVESEHNEYPETTVIPYSYYKTERLGVGVNSYISSDGEIESYATALASQVKTELADGKVEYTYNDCTTTSSKYLAEVKIAECALSSKVTLISSNKEQNTVIKELEKQGLQAKIISVNNYALYVISKK